MDEEGDVESDKEIVINIYVPNIYKKWYTSGVDNLTEDEKFLLTLVEPDIEKAKEVGRGDNIMEEYIKESIEVSGEEEILEAYDKEWAVRDQSYRDGKEETQREIVKKMLTKNIDIGLIMEITGFTRKEVNACLENR